MQQHVFRRRRKVGGKMVVARCFTGRYKLDGDSRSTEVALKVTDKRVAEKRLAEIVRDEQRGRAGLDTRGSHKLGEKIDTVLRWFCQDLERRGRGQKYIADVGRHVRIVAGHAGWDALGDIRPEGFLNWRIDNGDKAPKTLNEYLNAWNALLNWLVQTDAIPRNRLGKIRKAEERGKEQRRRRVLSIEQLRLLIAGAPPERALNYLAVAYTGLRANELASVRWSDIMLEGSSPRIIVRSESAKNKKTQTVPLRADLANLMREKLGRSPGDPPFTVPSRPYIYIKRDLEAVGIPYKDEEGAQADFHALRHAFGTHLQSCGASQSVAMNALRHSDPKLTAVTYAHADQLPIAEAVENLPSLLPNGVTGTHIGTHRLVAEGPGVSQPVANQGSKNEPQPAEPEAEGRAESQPVATSPPKENGSCGWIRTNDLVVNSHPLCR